MMEPALVVQETEVTPKAKRRWFSAKNKLRILRLVEACTQLGELKALTPKKRGRKALDLRVKATLNMGRARGPC